MVNLVGPIGNVATGLGAGLGGMLGQVGYALDTPRRWLWEGLGGPSTGRDLVASLTPYDEDSKAAHLLGFGAEILGDPLTYVGGALFRGLGRMAGKGLERAALARGPRYAGGVEKLAGGPPELVGKLSGSSDLSRVLGEIPEGSRMLPGASNQAIAMQTPAGDVLRIAGGDALPPSRLQIEEMLQPTRNVEVGNFRVERVPFAEDVGSRELFGQSYGPLSRSLRSKGVHPADMHPGNIGRFGDAPVLVDPGAAVPHPIGGKGLAVAPSIEAEEPGRFTSWLLDRLGADRRLQQSLGG